MLLVLEEDILQPILSLFLKVTWDAQDPSEALPDYSDYTNYNDNPRGHSPLSADFMDESDQDQHV